MRRTRLGSRRARGAARVVRCIGYSWRGAPRTRRPRVSPAGSRFTCRQRAAVCAQARAGFSDKISLLAIPEAAGGPATISTTLKALGPDPHPLQVSAGATSRSMRRQQLTNRNFPTSLGRSRRRCWSSTSYCSPSPKKWWRLSPCSSSVKGLCRTVGLMDTRCSRRPRRWSVRGRNRPRTRKRTSC